MPDGAKIFAGTSGFAYASWKPDFYPQKLPAKQFLNHYATRLNAVEINYTFRRLPSAATLQNWVESTPGNFVFVMKAHQRITHIQRLKLSEFNQVFFNAIDPLRVVRRLGPVLFQLPPNLKCDAALLADFLAVIPDGLRCAFEFRNKSWFDDSVYSMLEAKGAALCLAESDEFTVPDVITGGFVYARLRKSEYAPADIASIREKAQRITSEGKDVYLFFKHEETAAGALYAEEILR
ncbi:MAG: DUF72 domain-containing protein [Candidatus Solibacter usitatus]|nr:DUF72 domain-containing protein [Candidatus Solibacter usitatus]